MLHYSPGWCNLEHFEVPVWPLMSLFPTARFIVGYLVWIVSRALAYPSLIKLCKCVLFGALWCLLAFQCVPSICLKRSPCTLSHILRNLGLKEGVNDYTLWTSLNHKGDIPLAGNTFHKHITCCHVFGVKINNGWHPSSLTPPLLAGLRADQVLTADNQLHKLLQLLGVDLSTLTKPKLASFSLLQRNV